MSDDLVSRLLDGIVAPEGAFNDDPPIWAQDPFNGDTAEKCGRCHAWCSVVRPGKTQCDYCCDSDDYGLRIEAATAITEARAEIERLRGDLANERRVVTIQSEARVAAEAEPATVRDILILCGELGGMKPGETMADYLRRLIDEVAGKETERELAKAAAITAYLAQREKEGWVMVPAHTAQSLASFLEWAMRDGPWDGDDLDAASVQDKAESLGLIDATKFDPKKHGDKPWAAPGDEWFVVAADVQGLLAAAQNGGE